MSDDTKENDALGTGDQMAGEGQGGTQDDEATRRFKLFVGKNAEKFSALAEAEPNKRISFKFFNWAAMFVGVAWFFYRKLYLIGAAIIAVPLVLILVVPQFADFGAPGFGVVLGLFANSVYVWAAKKRIAKIEAMSLSPEETDERLRKAGGTSMVGLIFGLAIIVALISIPIVQLATAKLPECTNPEVQTFAQDVLRDSLTSQGIDASTLKMSDFRAMDNPGEARTCAAIATLGDETAEMTFILEWSDKAEGTFYLQYQ